MVRSATLNKLGLLMPRVHRCFEAGATATGCKLDIRGGDKPYAEMIHDQDLVALYRRNAAAVGRKLRDAEAGAGVDMSRAAGSTDMGNVSLKLPAIHPMIGINSLPAVNHQPEFTAAAATADADRAIFDGALAMAWTAIDAATDSALRNRLIAAASSPR